MISFSQEIFSFVESSNSECCILPCISSTWVIWFNVFSRCDLFQ